MRIGPYEVIRELGRGSFAAVFLAQRPNLPRNVAVKVLMQISHETDRARFKREARVTSGLEHPGIIGCYDIGQDERGFLYLALDYAPGGSLADRLSQQRLPVVEAVELVAQLADAIEYAHGMGILHRDLKPANILFDAAGRPQVSDFGLASYRGHMRLTASEDVLGTPYYMAPEQFDGRAVTPQVDIYGLGAILYHALTGDVLYRAEDMSDMREFIQRGRPAPPSAKRGGISPALDDVCTTAMAHDPDDRFMSAADMASALRASLADTAGSAASRPAPWGLIAGGLGALSLLIGVALLVRSLGSAPEATPTPAPPPRR